MPKKTIPNGENPEHDETDIQKCFAEVRELISLHGVRNLSITATMPTPHVTLISNSTPGCEPIQSFPHKSKEITEVEQP